jgi:hypothetical protein
MKQFSYVLALTMLLSNGITFGASAQTDKDMLPGQHASALDVFSLFSNKKYFLEMRINDVNIKAMRDFVKSFNDVQEEKWYKISDGFVSNFIEDGVQTKVVYDLKGRRHCILRAFNEEQMPPEIKGEVKERFYDYNIIVAYEINDERNSYYIIKIETATSLKILQLIDNEIEVKGDYTKK